MARVVALLAQWADGLRLDDRERTRWLRAGWLHDALRDADEAVLRHWSAEASGPVILLHGPAAAARAQDDGETDLAVLEAVRWHTIGSASWGAVGQALYCADYLEPGRPFAREERAALAGEFAADPLGVLRTVIRRRSERAARTHKPVLPATVAFVERFG